MRNRYYNPELKRFMNRDVLVGELGNTQTLNRYAYVNGNPISYNDPFGLARESIANNGWMGNVHTVLDVAGMVPGIGVVPDLLNASIYLAEGNYQEALWSSVGAIPVVGDSVSGIRKVSKVINDKGKISPILSNEGKVGKYKMFRGREYERDNLTPHHMPSSEYMRKLCGVSNNEGVCMMMEQPYPGVGGRHRQTFTYGRMKKEVKEWYLNLSPRDALAHDIIDAKRIYKEQGLYTKEIRKGLLETIKKNKEYYPEHFGK